MRERFCGRTRVDGDRFRGDRLGSRSTLGDKQR
jgi:hypothetical protein